MKKKILLYAIALIIVAMISGGTFAYFTDQAANTGNTFRAATVAVQTWSPLGVGGQNLAPGESANAHSDTINIDLSLSTIDTRLSMTVVLHDDNPGLGGAGGSLTEGLNIDSIKYDGVDVISGGSITFDDLVGPTGTRTYTIGTIPANTTPKNLVINWHFPSHGAQDNDYQGANFMLDCIFTVEQIH